MYNRNSQLNSGIPLFFKFWFGLILCLVLAAWGGIGYVGYTLYQSGPEIVGKVAGSVVHGFNETRN